MIHADIPPDNFALMILLNAVKGIQDLDLGKQIYTHFVKFRYALSSMIIVNSLVNMFSKCENIEDTYKMFERITRI